MGLHLICSSEGHHPDISFGWATSPSLEHQDDQELHEDYFIMATKIVIASPPVIRKPASSCHGGD
jgi:hypothetical protein